MAEIKTITINHKTYSIVKNREHVEVSVFKGDDSFLRLGPESILKSELAFHKKLFDYGFPVPKIIEEGYFDNQFYYSEQSLGDELLGDLFWEDCKNDRKISDENFEAMLKVCAKFTEAQLKTASPTSNNESFYLGTHIDVILQELPHLQDKINSAFEKISENTKTLPYVLTHGDFNSYNIFKNGVIDFGSSFEAPAGYDLVSNICHTYFFPDSGNYESMRRYQFSAAQVKEYFNRMDEIYISNNLPKLSSFINDFTLCRNIWATVRMQRYPNLQQWRYENFEHKLDSYLNDEPIFEKLISNT